MNIDDLKTIVLHQIDQLDGKVSNSPMVSVAVGELNLAVLFAGIGVAAAANEISENIYIRHNNMVDIEIRNEIRSRLRTALDGFIAGNHSIDRAGVVLNVGQESLERLAVIVKENYK